MLMTTPGGAVVTRSHGSTRSRRLRSPTLSVACFIIAVLASCDSDSVILAVNENESVLPDLTLADVAIVAGDEQEAVVASVTPEPLVVRVTDAEGGPLSGVPLEWVFSQGGAKGSPNSAPAESFTTATDDQGRSEVEWMLGTSAGSHEASVYIILPGDSTTATGDGPSTASRRHGRHARFRVRARPGAPAQISVAPDPVSLSESDTLTLQADVADRYGNTVEGSALSWDSSNETIASVDDAGLVTALAAGSAQILASTGSVDGATSVTVAAADTPGPVEPGTVTDLRVVATTDATVTLRWSQVDDGEGNAANFAIRMASPSISWSAASGTEVVVPGTDIAGQLDYQWSGLLPSTQYEFQLVAFRGGLGVDAVLGGLSNTASVRTEDPSPPEVARVVASPDIVVIESVGGTSAISAYAEGSGGERLQGITFGYMTSDTTVVEVDTMGRLRAKAVGTAVITVSALCCGVSDSVLVEVNDVVSSLTVTSTESGLLVGELSLDVGDSAMLEASALNAIGQLIGDVAISWSSLDPSVASVSDDGVIEGESEGSTEVYAEAMGVTATIPVTVTIPGTEPEPGVPTTITVTPSSFGLQVDGTRRLSAVVRDADGILISGASITWSAEEPEVASVNAAGLVTAHQIGSTTIYATHGSLRAGASVTVNPPSSGAAPLFTESFERGSPTSIPGVVGSWSLWSSRGFDSVKVTNGGVARTGSYSAVQAASGASGNATGGVWFQLTGNPEEVWIEFWEYVPTNWHMNGDHQHKWFGAFGGSSQDDYGANSAKFIAAMWPRSGGSQGYLRIGVALANGCEGAYTGGDNTYNRHRDTTAWDAATQGRWRRWRVHLKSHETESVMDMWVDNTKLVEYPPDAPSACDQMTGVNRAWRNIRLGWAQDDGFPERMARYFDDISVWDVDPQWTFN